MPLEFSCPVCQTPLTALARAWPKIDQNGPVPDVRPDLGPCWVWTGALNAGYGVMAIDGHQRRVHRVVWETMKGVIPDGLFLDHLCRNRRCVNPDHLEAVTSGENWRRGDHPHAIAMRNRTCTRGHVLSADTVRRTGSGYLRCVICLREAARAYYRAHPPELRGARHGERHHAAKLTEDDVREIRRLYALGEISLAALSRAYGVGTTNIEHIVRGHTWRHVT